MRKSSAQQSLDTARRQETAQLGAMGEDFRAGLVALLSRQTDMHVVGEAAAGQETLALFPHLMPTVLILEVALPDMAGDAVIRALRQQFPAAGILVFSRHQEEEIIYRAVKAGAHGYCFKDADGSTLVDAVRLIGSGGYYVPVPVHEKLASRIQREELTPKEQAVLALLAEGLSNKEISARLLIAEGPIKVHITNLLAKLQAASRTHAAVIALRLGLVTQ